ncbi:MAG: hypothetical protein E3J72_00855 [Planctomycetota bacterium]|nr:MAG: hypothetical protein E3J72_00855 [Planctomycetota bacterium]
MAENDNVSREALFAAIVSEAAGFYKIITITGSSFLGGSLLFMEKIAPNPKMWTLWYFLLPSWLFIIASIGIVIYVRRKNIESGRLALEGKYDEATEIDRQTAFWSTTSMIALLVGMLLLLLFGLINIAYAAT